jgi:hypothetical protein
VERANLLGRVAFESNGATVRACRNFVVDRLSHAKGASVVPIEETRMSRLGFVSQRLSRAKRAEYSVIEALRSLNVIRANHHVVDHAQSPSPAK